MADITKINNGMNTYDVKDASAFHTVSSFTQGATISAGSTIQLEFDVGNEYKGICAILTPNLHFLISQFYMSLNGKAIIRLRNANASAETTGNVIVYVFK